MSRTQKEHDVLRAAERALESDSLATTKESIFDLLNMFQKLSRRIDKILKQSDKQQEVLINLNDELTQIKDKQASNLSKIIAEQKRRAIVAMESRTRLLSSHKQEIASYESNMGELTSIITEKAELERKYKLLLEDFNELKKLSGNDIDAKQEYTNHDFEEILQELRKDDLESSIAAYTKNLFELEVLSGNLDNLKFAKNFLKKLSNALQNDYIKQKNRRVEADKLTNYIMRIYIEDILCVVADCVVEGASKRNVNAWSFINFFNGEVSLDMEGRKFKTPELVDSQFVRWTPGSISQVYVNRLTVLKQINQKQEFINSLIKKHRVEITNSAEMVELLDTSTVAGEQQIQSESVTEPMNYESVHEDDASSGAEDIKNEINTMNLEVTENFDNDVVKNVISSERAKVILLQEKLKPLEDKYNAILMTIVKAMLELMGRK